MQSGAGAQAGKDNGRAHVNADGNAAGTQANGDRRRQAPQSPGSTHWQEETVVFRVGTEAKRARTETRAATVLREVYWALQEKGYDPISQLVGYLLSGDPTYITSYAGARALVRSVERDELLEELLHTFMQSQTGSGATGEPGGRQGS